MQTSTMKRTAEAFEQWVRKGGHLMPNVTMQDAAAIMGVDTFDLDYYCKAFLHDGFLRWRKKERMAIARMMIEEDPHRSIAAVRTSVGIEDKTNFRRAFYETYRITPGEFRAKCLKARKE